MPRRSTAGCSCPLCHQLLNAYHGGSFHSSAFFLHARSRPKLSRQRRPRPERARHCRWRDAPDVCAMVPAHFGIGRRLRRDRSQDGRSPCHRAAEPLGGSNAALGLPVCGHRHHAGELALDRKRDRFLSRRRRGQSDRLRGRFRCRRNGIGCRAKTAAHRPRQSTAVRYRLCRAGRSRRRRTQRRGSMRKPGR